MAKFYTSMRKRLQDMRLQSSALAVFIAVHTLCDPNTGRFFRDDSAVRQITGMPRSTVFLGFHLLKKSPLIRHLGNGEYVITDYESDRNEQPTASYFRLTPGFLRSLGQMVAHHNSRIILFGLEILDCSRNIAPEIRRKMRTLIRDKQLGSCPSRVYSALQLIEGFVRFATTPNESGDDVVQFWVINDEARTVVQDEWRALHGSVTHATIEGYRFAKGERQMTWRELSRSTKLILEYGIQQHLSKDEIIRLGGYFGILCAKYKIRRKLAYLKRIRDNGDLIKVLTVNKRSA